jgi:hypothetical protein
VQRLLNLTIFLPQAEFALAREPPRTDIGRQEESTEVDVQAGETQAQQLQSEPHEHPPQMDTMLLQVSNTFLDSELMSYHTLL